MLKVLKSGFYTSIQDEGRFGHRSYGVPISGAMDSYSSQFANTLLGNSRDAAVMELTMTGPTLHFLQPTVIAISGAEMSPSLNNKTLKINTIVAIQNGDVLSFGKLRHGFRTYIAIKGGFLITKVLNSRSMYKGITTEGCIKVNDVVDYPSYVNEKRDFHANVKYDNAIIESNTIEVFKGSEFDSLTEEMQNKILNNYKISKLNNRMAYQLKPLFNNNLQPILTSPVLPGTVQLTPSGRLIILMRDCQTTGGYPRVLQLTEKSINILSQKITGNNLKIRLKEI